MTTPVWISLGSNVGDRRATLDAALVLLDQNPGVVVSAVSSYHETNPVGGPPGQGAFLNAAARLETSLSPRELLATTQAVENQLGRVRTVRWAERTLDLDLLMYGCRFVDEPDLKLPHPRLAVRPFVLKPLVEVAPDVVDPITRRTIADLLANLGRRPHLLMLDDSIRGLDPAIADRLADAVLADTIHHDLIAEVVTEPLHRSPEVDRNRRETLAALDLINASARRFDGEAMAWIVADFRLDVRGLKEIATQDADQFCDEGWWQWHADERWKDLLRSRLDDTPEPTLIVAGAGSKPARKPNISQTPIYWPEATDPASIVAEVAAVCWGIEAI